MYTITLLAAIFKNHFLCHLVANLWQIDFFSSKLSNSSTKHSPNTHQLGLLSDVLRLQRTPSQQLFPLFVVILSMSMLH